MSDPLFITDGYNRRGYIAAVSGIHGELRFEYRPMLILERAEFERTRQTLTGPQIERLAAEAVAKRLLSWSAGRQVTVDTLLQLQPALWDRLFMIVFGQRSGDLDPQETDRKETLRELDAGPRLAEMREAGDVGNSARV